MGLQVFGRGKAGEIILHDQRPDGTAILLVCEQFGPGPSPPDEVGVGFASTTDGGIFPMLDETGVAKRKFKLHLDTTAMPSGPMRFGMDPFTRRALQAAEEGYREVQLNPENAEDWGWQGAAPSPDVAQPSPAAQEAHRPRRQRRASEEPPAVGEPDLIDG